MIVGVLAFLNITTGEETIVVFIPPLSKEKLLRLGPAIVKFGHTAALCSRRLRIFHTEYKTNYRVRSFGVACLSSFTVPYGSNASNEMTTMLVRFIHLHHRTFVDERLFFRS